MRYLFVFALLSLSLTTRAQNITKQQIDGWLLKCDTAYKTSKIWGYALNKRSYEAKDSVQLDADLKLIKNTDLLTVDPFWNEEILETTENPGKLYVLIVTRGKQSADIKRSILKTALGKYKLLSTTGKPISDASVKEPVMLINGHQVAQPDCYAQLSKLKIESIADIYYSKHPIPTELYGPNAKNGVVTVWIK
ncbi:MAG: hypothetical protein JKY70_14815 [Mucilaginibacter sp.]|nr:hypothetical protein [Mucilaginibacter sp.]